MAANPLSSSIRLQRQTLNASPTRYNTQDGTAAGQQNRTVALFAECVPWVSISGNRIQVLQHDIASDGRDAAPLDNSAGNPGDLQPITADTPYLISDTFESGNGISPTFILGQISALADVRDYASDVLSDDYDQTEFQKEAIKHAIAKEWEREAIQGNPDPQDPNANLGEFFGLQVLTNPGSPVGQNVPAATPGVDVHVS